METSMWLLLPLLLWLMLATSSFSGEQEDEPPPEVLITYKVLEVFPRSRRVLISCHAPRKPPPVKYLLWGSRGILVARKVVTTREAASFYINVTLKSRPDLLTYSCQLDSPWLNARHDSPRRQPTSSELQLYWELWAKPVSEPQANFTLQDNHEGALVHVSCQAQAGSPPITYSLVGKDGHVHTRQTPSYGQPAHFSLPVSQTSRWFQCQAENNVSIGHSPLTLVPPGLLPSVPTLVLASSLSSIAAISSGMLGWTMRTRL